MARPDRLDEKDRQIVSLLVKDPGASQSYIAAQVNLSQPSVGARIQRLKDNGAIAFYVGMDLNRVGLHLAKVEIAAKNTGNVLKRIQGCPWFLNALIVSGSHNICVLLVGEDISSMEALIENHVRQDPEVTEALFEVVASTSNDIVLPIDLMLNKNESPPCGHPCNCANCMSYEMDRCTGCPASEFYRGTFWS